MKPTEYRGVETEQELHGRSFVTRTHLEDLIPASNGEINQYLHKHSVVEIDGYLRMLCKDILNEKIRLVLDTIIENQWSLEAIDEDACAARTVDVDSIFLAHILSKLGTQTSPKVWKLAPETVAKYTADLLFRFQPDPSKVFVDITSMKDFSTNHY